MTTNNEKPSNLRGRMVDLYPGSWRHYSRSRNIVKSQVLSTNQEKILAGVVGGFGAVWRNDPLVDYVDAVGASG